ncbi:uncharacterized protein LOC128548426 [Mercenaria mercenaria]|uniref:uncharacterized protein LOC128548426 n=1 Tax=Mercenaria mercenaria TaxID=6596 RepID=UPI00234E83D0|nr:uncharacterized protein LOC128548426 [Mercenaria mercenaria]
MAGPLGFFIVDVKTRKILAICLGVTLLLFAIGILIGYFSGHGSQSTSKSPSQESVADAIRSSCHVMTKQTPTGSTYFDRYLERHSGKTACVNKPEGCWDFGLPRNYIAYHLQGKVINIDGKLDDDAWNEVPWSETFVDMRSKVFPKPYFDTKFKIRWDDARMYIGAYIQEKDLWATQQEHDSSIYRENGFEVLIDADGSMFNYKQAQINVLGTMLDLILAKSPYDAPWGEVANVQWHANAEKAVYPEGTVNTPGDTDKYWSVEISLPFHSLAEQSVRPQPKPSDNQVWFIQFGRSEQKLIVSNGHYEIAPNSTTDWWSWQPCDTINLHLQDRWGLVQFKHSIQDKKFRFDKWHIYKSLFDMMNAMKKFKAINGFYTKTIEELDVPPYLLSRTCVEIPEIKLIKSENGTDFDVTVKSMFLSHAPAHIRSDRYVTFK